MLKTAYYAILNTVWGFSYFIGYGLFYGAALGLIAGTAFFPLLGTLIGLVIGIVIGGGSGIILGIGVPLLHLIFFDRDTNLERYRQRLAKGVGGLFALIGGFAALVVVLMYINALSERYARSTDFKPVEWLFLAAVWGTIVLWTSLSSAYTASYYPDRIVERMIRQRRLKIDHSMIRIADHDVMRQSDWLLKRFFTVWIYGGSVVIVGSLLIIGFTRWVQVPQGMEWILVAAYALIVAAGILGLCCGVGNVALIVFLKRLVMPDMPPHRTRVMLTLVSFFYTLIAHWWTLIFAPVIALFIAYHVYHTLAIADEYGNKAKRKEAMAEFA